MALFAAAIAVRLCLAPFHAFANDLLSFYDFGRFFSLHPFDVYSAGIAAHPHGFNQLPPNYPPLTLYIDAALARLIAGIQAMTGAAGGPDVAAVGWSAAIMKLPALLADLVAMAVILGLGRRVATPRVALLAAGLYALSPVVLLDGALWGQTDVIAASLVLVGILAATEGHDLRAGAAMAAALMIKPQPLVFVPVVLCFIFKRGGAAAAMRYVVSGAAMLVAIWLPVLLTHPAELAAFRDAVGVQFGPAQTATASAFNLWWLAGQSGTLATAPLLGPISLQDAGTLLVVGSVAAVCVALLRSCSETRLVLGAALVATSFFVLGPIQHERYLVPAIPLLVLATIYQRSSLWLLLVASASAFFNMVVILVSAPPSWLSGAGLTDLPRLVALVNVGLVAAIAVAFGRAGRAEGTVTTAAPSLAAAG